MNENVVSYLCVPACAKIKKIVSCQKYGEVAAIIDWYGNELTFFRTDFLEFSKVPWYFAEKFFDEWYHEEVPENVLESIQKNGGFFLTRKFLEAPTRAINLKEAKLMASAVDTPALQSDLMYGVIYDVLGKWLIETETLTEEEWVKSPTDKLQQQKLLTRDCGGWCLAELLEDIFQKEWTQEMFGFNRVVTRMGIPSSDGETNYPARMRMTYDPSIANGDAKIRAFLYFK